MFLKKKRNYHEIIHGGAIGIKNYLGERYSHETPVCTRRCLKQAKNRVSGWSFRNNAIES